MTDIETLQASLAAISKRLAQLEAAHQPPCAEARAVATHNGIDPEAACDPHAHAERRRLAHALHDQGWSYSQIARAMRCAEKTVARYLATP